ncbi:serine hydrolase domain-containing protein [Gemmatimonas phototrophica]|uniref:serine hydrolase domain-containing protein n=1 Tax=Gemmatimonas phototrophica TaxID=1379270 RepID=UPI0009EEBD02|nr:serine hydrolase domain-containing protein [Gemmatimonas phototrophica]
MPAPHTLRAGRATAVVAVLLSSAMAPSAVAQSVPAWAPALDSVANAAIATSKSPGVTVAVVVNGQLAYAKGYGLANVDTKQPMHADMLLRVGSVTKMFTGTMLAALIEKNLLDMEQPISRYVPSLAGKQVGAVTTQQLMTHNAGWIDNAVAYGRMGEGALGEVMREVGDTLFFTGAGRTFSYSNPSISMAGYVGEMAGKQRFASLVESNVLRPLGMRLSTFKPLEALTWPIAMGHMGPNAGGNMTVVRPMTENTAQWAAGFLFSSAPELARYTIAMMNGGTIDGADVLPRGVVRRVTTGYVPHPGGSGLDSAMYGYGLVVGTARVNGKPERVWTHGGAINGYNSSLVMLPDRKVAVVVLANGPGSGNSVIERKALELVMGAPLARATPAAPRDLTTAERAALVGTYAMGPVTVEFAELNGALVMKQGAASLPVKAASPSELVVGPQRLYTRTENGKVVYVYNGSRALARKL